MKKTIIAALLVLALVLMPVMAMAATTDNQGNATTNGTVPYANNTAPSDALDPQDSSWLYYKNPVTLKTETAAPAEVVIPASGVASFAVIASVIATLGCAVLPKK
ncbi:MAG: hypothetical protein E7334_01615 [Clostridiales bacterium]|nr:hypothetical protein [Clostridiales bacterium]